MRLGVDRLSWAAPSKARPVALKSIKNSQDMTSEYINELQTHYRLDWSSKLYLLRNISGNLLTIHKAGFTHRDLHPGNILVGQVKKDGKIVTVAKLAHLGTPENYVRLATQCFHMNPSERPDARFLAHTFNNWWNLTQEDNVLSNAFITADEKISELDTSFNKHPDAIYTSRLITFENSDSNSSDKTLNYLPPNVVKQI
ncbi:68_t:CDS:2 [Rhizophagus irregularis]|nr:68_t:CDS:2 [Rhizophagus irregularis]